MDTTVLVGMVIIAGFLLGKGMDRFGLPRVTGYIIAGLLLNPSVFDLIPENFPRHTQPVVDIALAFITFAIGGTLSLEKLRLVGAKLFAVTLAEAVLTFVCIFAGTLLLFPALVHGTPDLAGWGVILPFTILMASLGAPTDPSATLAVEHEYGARGKLSQAIMGIAAFDDALGILFFSVGAAGSAMFFNPAEVSFSAAVLETGYAIFGGMALGIGFGLIFNWISRFLKFSNESEGIYIVLVLGLLSLCFGIADTLALDELLATMLMGLMVVNFHSEHEKIFHMLERYTEELIFLLFFTLSAMHLDFAFSGATYLLIGVFVGFRALGKYTGVYIGAGISGLDKTVKKYAAGGLIPQGGIVIGLALMVQNKPEFAEIGGLLMNTVMGATVIHEIIGPLCTKFVLKKSGDI
ncbi:MAG: cation:proton antiporter [Desulfobacterales bacterium]